MGGRSESDGVAVSLQHDRLARTATGRKRQNSCHLDQAQKKCAVLDVMALRSKHWLRSSGSIANRHHHPTRLDPVGLVGAPTLLLN
jgi:hypothetical protein